VDGTGSIELTPSVDASIDLYKKASASVNVDAGLRLDKAKNGIPAWALDSGRPCRHQEVPGLLHNPGPGSSWIRPGAMR
jgi:hypothetical protein